MEYYQLTFDFKGKPQIKIYLINRNLEFKYDESSLILTWKSIKGDNKKIIVKSKSEITDKHSRSNLFNLRARPDLWTGKKRYLILGEAPREKDLRAIENKKRRAEKRIEKAEGCLQR